MTDETAAGAQKALAAPYTAYQSVRSVVGTHKEHGVPGRIDRTMLKNFSGAVGSQVLTAFRFLRLIDDAGHPLPIYRALVDAHGTETWKEELTKVLHQAYAPLFEHDLKTASPGQFTEYFRRAYPSEGETLRKGTTFFLNAARDAGIAMSPYITSGMKQRTGGATGRRRATRANNRAAAAQQPESINGAAQNAGNVRAAANGSADLTGQLVGKFPAFDPAWDDTIKAKWFEGFRQLVDVVEKPRRREHKPQPTTD
jgi:Family of unknown function (DUF5343)